MFFQEKLFTSLMHMAQRLHLTDHGSASVGQVGVSLAERRFERGHGSLATSTSCDRGGAASTS